MSAPATTDDAARAEHKRLFDAQVQKRMSGVKEKSQFLTQATHSAILTCMQTWNSLEPKCNKQTCSCFKAGRKCNSRCHKGSAKCTNHDD